MPGSKIEAGRGRKRFFLMVPAALQILLLLAVLLLAASAHVFRMENRALLSYELEQYKSVAERCSRTGTKQLSLGSRDAGSSGGSLDLEQMMQKISVMEPVSARVRGTLGYEFQVESRGQTGVSMDVRCLVLDGSGEGELVALDGSGVKLDRKGRLYRLCQDAFGKDSTLIWAAPDGELLEEGELPGMRNITGEYMLLQAVPLSSPVRFRDKTLLEDPAGAGIGMLISADLSPIRTVCRNRAAEMAAAFFGLMFTAASLLCLGVHISLSPLRSLQGLMKDYRRSLSRHPEEEAPEENVRHPSAGRAKGSREMKELTESFYVMSGRLQDYRDTVEMTRARYAPFLPEELPAVFGKKDILEIRPGDTAAVRGDRLEVELISAAGGRLPERANRFYGPVCEMISGKGGFITSIDIHGVTAVFRKAGGAAEAERLAASLKLGEEFGKLRTKITNGTWLLQVTGCDEKMDLRLVPAGSEENRSSAAGGEAGRARRAADI